MRKQTKLVAVLSTAALLAIGASMTSFAATGWAEEDGTWVYYDKNGDRVTDKWAKSGNNWYYLDGSGEMAIDQLIEDGDNYYYVDVNGVMVTNQWVAISNEDSGTDNEPDEWWYYFQANGKALRGPEDNKVSLKTVNGKKYAFTSEGKMLYGWVDADDATIINDDDDAWQRGDYFFGDQNDGAMTVGWRLIDITDDSATSESDGNNWIQTAYNDDEDQSRWFWFKSNGKKQTSANEGDLELKQKTINGKKYAFDQYGRMIAEWAVDFDEASNNFAKYKNADGTLIRPNAPVLATGGSATVNNAKPDWSRAWMYFNSVEDGARVTKGWFKVVPAEGLNAGKYTDDEDGWYYADNNGHLYAAELKTIKGKKYGFDANGKMLDGMHFLKVSNNIISGQVDDDDDTYPFDTESGFDTNSIRLAVQGYECYYFGADTDGALKTGKMQVEIDGEKFAFNFGKSGSLKGAGKIGKDDKKYYNSGKLMSAGKDEKYQVVYPWYRSTDGKLVGYGKYDDAAQFTNSIANGYSWYTTNSSGVRTTYTIHKFDSASTIINEIEKTGTKLFSEGDLSKFGLTKAKLKDSKYADLTLFVTETQVGSAASTFAFGLPSDQYMLANTSGTISTSNAKCKDGNNVYYKLYSGRIVSTFSED